MYVLEKLKWYKRLQTGFYTSYKQTTITCRVFRIRIGSSADPKPDDMEHPVDLNADPVPAPDQGFAFKLEVNVLFLLSFFTF